MAFLALVLFLHFSIAFLGDVNAETVQEEEETGMKGSQFDALKS